jgi:hypothetical protein
MRGPLDAPRPSRHRDEARHVLRVSSTPVFRFRLDEAAARVDQRIDGFFSPSHITVICPGVVTGPQIAPNEVDWQQ